MYDAKQMCLISDTFVLNSTILSYNRHIEGAVGFEPTHIVDAPSDIDLSSRLSYAPIGSEGWV